MLRTLSWIPALLRETQTQEASPPLDLRKVHAEHADFVWASLQRLGVRKADLADLHQEVFLVVHQKLHTYDGRASVRAWLFGICRCKAAAYRRRAWFRFVEPVETMDQWADEGSDPQKSLEAHQARVALERILDRLDLDKRAVFVMFELEGMSCEAIAETLGVPVGTVYSRLHTARKAFEKAAARLSARKVVDHG